MEHVCQSLQTRLQHHHKCSKNQLFIKALTVAVRHTASTIGCHAAYTGRGNVGMNYDMEGTIICQTVRKKDLGVTMTDDMKVSEQCRIAASKSSHVLGMILRNIT